MIFKLIINQKIQVFKRKPQYRLVQKKLKSIELRIELPRKIYFSVLKRKRLSISWMTKISQRWKKVKIHSPHLILLNHNLNLNNRIDHKLEDQSSYLKRLTWLSNGVWMAKMHQHQLEESRFNSIKKLDHKLLLNKSRKHKQMFVKKKISKNKKNMLRKWQKQPVSFKLHSKT